VVALLPSDLEQPFFAITVNHCDLRAALFQVEPAPQQAQTTACHIMDIAKLSDPEMMRNLREHFNKGRLQEYSDAHDCSMMPPHIWAVASTALRACAANSEDQSIVLRGESGAGKTFTAPCLQIRATVSMRSIAGLSHGGVRSG